MFIILSGSSGAGKNTVINELQRNNENFVLMPTYTTREKREGEVEGKPYFYIEKEVFQDKIKNSEFIEHEFIHNNYYGSSYLIFDDYIRKGNILIKDIGVEGAQNLSKKLADRTKIIKVFLTVKKGELKNRLIGRGEKQIKLRLGRYNYEQKQLNKFDYIIYNEDLLETTALINSLINLENKDFYSKKDLSKLSKYKVKYYANKLTAGKNLSPIKIVVKDNKAYIVSGVEKLMASIITNIPVAKLIVKKDIKVEKYKYQFENWYSNTIANW